MAANIGDALLGLTSKLICCHASSTNTVFNSEHHITWDFNKLANQTQILATWGNNGRSITRSAWLEHRYDVGQHAWDACYILYQVGWNTTVLAQLIEYFLTCAVHHAFGNIISNLVRP